MRQETFLAGRFVKPFKNSGLFLRTFLFEFNIQMCALRSTYIGLMGLGGMPRMK